MKPKVFFSDLDGTLLTTDKQITEETRAAVQSFINAGNYFAICTGRPTSSGIEIFRSLHLNPKNCFVIAYNGAQIYDCTQEKIISQKGLTRAEVAEILDLCSSHGIHCHTFLNDHVLCRERNSYIEHYIKMTHLPVQTTENIPQQLPLKGTPKVLAMEFHDHEALEALHQDIRSKYSDHLQALYSSALLVEIISTNTGKGIAVQDLCDYLGIPISDSIAAGDQENDISMIQAAGTGIAMKNGVPEIIQAADIISPYDNDHNGLAIVIQKYI